MASKARQINTKNAQPKAAALTWYFWLCAMSASSASPTAPLMTCWYTNRLLAFRVKAAKALGEGVREGADAAHMKAKLHSSRQQMVTSHRRAHHQASVKQVQVMSTVPTCCTGFSFVVAGAACGHAGVVTISEGDAVAATWHCSGCCYLDLVVCPTPPFLAVAAFSLLLLQPCQQQRCRGRQSSCHEC